MSISVEVKLLSGKNVTMSADLEEKVETVKLRAQIALGVGRCRLVNLSGVVVESLATIQDANAQNRDCLLLQVLQVNLVQVCGAHHAFAAILGDGSVVTWGSAQFGGNSRVVQDQLENVHQIHATQDAFAALRGDGTVVTWGDAGSGGDSSAVQERLKNVQQIQGSDNAFAAILKDGSVVTWGMADGGGNSSAVQNQLKNVQHIQAAGRAFAAILWGWIRRDLGLC